MIGRLHGLLIEKTLPQVMVDCGGVGYVLDVPMSTFFNLPDLNQPVTLLTHLVVREDAHVLFGFLTAAERDVFRQLIKVSGIGPRSALGILSGMSVNDFKQAVAQQEVARLVKVPGIGQKTAQRLLLELKGKLVPAQEPGPAPVSGSTQDDIVQALLALGYSDKEAQLSLKKLPPGVDASEGIKLALRALTQ